MTKDYKEAAAYYLRKSRADDPNESVDETLSRHEKILNEYAIKNNITVTAVYKEVASGEGLFTRPEMLRLLKDVELGMFTAVMCIDIDRLGRSSSKDSGIIMETIRDAGCRIITPDKVYDLEDETDEMTVEMRTFIARQEWRMIRKRMRRGITEALKEGGHIGALPYGYKRSRAGKLSTLEPYQPEADIVRMIFDIYTNGGEGTNKIRDKLNSMGIKGPSGGEWSKNSIRMILKNPVYCGMIVWNRTKWIKKKKADGKLRVKNNDKSEWITAKGIHKPLITEEQFKEAQEILMSRTQVSKFTGEIKNPYSGILYCMNCKRPAQRQVDHKGNNVTRLYCTKTGCNCGLPLPSFEDALKTSIAEEIKKAKLEPEGKDTNIEKKAKENIKTIKKQLTTIKSQRSRLHDLLEQGVYDIHTYMERQKELTSRETAAETELERLEETIKGTEQKPDRKELIPTAEKLLDEWNTLDPADKNKIIKKLIKRIEYRRTDRSYKDGVKFDMNIEWLF